MPPACVPEVFQGVCHANHIRKMQVMAEARQVPPGLLQLGLGPGLPLLRGLAAGAPRPHGLP